MAERQPSKLHVASSNLVSRSTSPADMAAASAALRTAIGREVRAGAALTDAAQQLSAAYRSGAAPANPTGHVHDSGTAAAYAAARMPATFAAIGRALAATADRVPAFAPLSQLDVGAGTGAAAWAANAIWPGLSEVTLVDREPAMVDLGRRLATGHPSLATADWRLATMADELGARADLVTAAYLLGELDDGGRPPFVGRLWAATRGVLILVEPGSTTGFERIRAARAALIVAGGHVIAPCPGDAPCPIAGAAWCHFLARLDRSPLQRTVKSAARSWEDEPFSFVAVSREPAAPPGGPTARVVLGRPRQRPGVIELRICVDGRIETRTLSRRDGPGWKAARDLAWGDAVPPEVLDAGR